MAAGGRYRMDKTGRIAVRRSAPPRRMHSWPQRSASYSGDRPVRGTEETESRIHVNASNVPFRMGGGARDVPRGLAGAYRKPEPFEVTCR